MRTDLDIDAAVKFLEGLATEQRSAFLRGELDQELLSVRLQGLGAIILRLRQHQQAAVA